MRVIASLCLLAMVARAQTGPCPARFNERISAQAVVSEYRTAPGGTSGVFRSGQPADLALSAFGFNQSGGPLQFRYNSGIATDGSRLLVADRGNNRVLIWNSLPESNKPPDLVLGQPDFDTTDSGEARHQLNWPIAVATDGRRVVVADTNNDRLLVWNSFPTANGAPADLEIRVQWPWGVWTDGTKLVATATINGTAFVWRSIPTRDNQPADFRLRARGDFGTPRTITSNGRYLMIGDHNSKVSRAGQGNFVWRTFPDAEDAPYDFFTADPIDENVAWLQGSFTDSGAMLTLGGWLHLWKTAPMDRAQRPDLTIRSFNIAGGDGSDVAVAGGRVYVSGANGNRVLVYNSVPESDRAPDFAIGSPDICTNTLDSNYFITNPIPASNGKSLYVTSDFDRKLYIWKSLPDESGARPDLVYSLNDAPWQNALHGETFVAAGKRTILVWRQLPDGVNMPEILRDRVGTAVLQEIRGVAYDGVYLSVADMMAGRVYVWEGIPSANTAPKYTLEVDRPGKLSSDGEWLLVAPFEGHTVLAYRFGDLGGTVEPRRIGGAGKFNLVGHALVAGGQLFVADTSFHRVHWWRSMDDALAGRDAAAVLGSQDRRAGTSRERMFMPGGVSFDGSYLWVGEFKFSGRLLRHSPGE